MVWPIKPCGAYGSTARGLAHQTLWCLWKGACAVDNFSMQRDRGRFRASGGPFSLRQTPTGSPRLQKLKATEVPSSASSRSNMTPRAHCKSLQRSTRSLRDAGQRTGNAGRYRIGGPDQSQRVSHPCPPLRLPFQATPAAVPLQLCRQELGDKTSHCSSRTRVGTKASCLKAFRYTDRQFCQGTHEVESSPVRAKE